MKFLWYKNQSPRHFGFVQTYFLYYPLPYLGADLFLKKWVPLKDKRNVFLVCSAGLLVITLNEIAQLFPIFKRTFDYFDLLFSLIGVGLGYYIFVQYFLTKTSKESSK